MDHYYRAYNANVHRGIYEISEKATAAYEGAREQVARFINAPSAREIVWARNATEAINLVAYSWGRRQLGQGDAIVLTEMEHHANLVPWQILAQEVDGDLEFIPITDEGILRLDVFEVLLRLHPKLVAFTHVSNTLGTINPVREMVEMAHAAGALVLVDGAQAVPHLPVDVQELGADFYVFSGHKMLGPTGSGVLWGRRELLDAMPPFMAGGDMIREVKLRRSEFNDVPWKFEAGTPDISAAIGLGVAADYLRELGMDRVREHERALVAYALEMLAREVPGIALYGPPADGARRGGAVQPARHPPPRRRPDPGPRRGSASGPATTARCPSTSASTWPRPAGQASPSSRRPTTSTPWPPACGRSSGSSGGRRVGAPPGLDALPAPGGGAAPAPAGVRHEGVTAGCQREFRDCTTARDGRAVLPALALGAVARELLATAHAHGASRGAREGAQAPPDRARRGSARRLTPRVAPWSVHARREDPAQGARPVTAPPLSAPAPRSPSRTARAAPS